MGRSKPRMFQASAKTKKQYKAFVDVTFGSVAAAGKTHRQLVKYRKARRAQVKASMRGKFIGRMPVLALLIRLWTGHGCITKLFLLVAFAFYIVWFPMDLLIALIATPFAK